MYKEKSVAVVIPAFNETTQIRTVVETMPIFVDYLVIVDDCSKDNTVSVVAALKSQFPKIQLIQHPKNQGVGAAIATGYCWARDHNIDIAVVMAGDGQMDPTDLPAILDPVVEGKADYTKGNRLFTDQAFQKIPTIRFLGNSALSFLTKIASGYWHIFDSQTGYTAINKRALHTINWDKMYKRFGQPNDLLARLNVFQFKVMDVPIKPVYNIGEKSKLKVRKAIFSISWLLIKIFLWRLKEKYIIRDFHPLVCFYLLGFFSFLLSLGFFIRLNYLWYTTHQVPELTLLSLLFCAGTALQATFFAMWFDMDYNRAPR